MKRICEKCGREFSVEPGFAHRRQKYCYRCGRKSSIPTQEQLAKRAGRSFIDRVQQDSDEADKLGVSYGEYVAKEKNSRKKD